MPVATTTAKRVHAVRFEEGMADRRIFFHRRGRATSLSITIVPPLSLSCY
jgi:hypothetical protein